MVDTHRITALYMRRPSDAVSMPMGQWFCTALNLDDADLSRDGSSFSVKDKILERGYNTIGNLEERLSSYNQTLEKR